MRKRLIPFLLAILLLPMASMAQTHYVIPIGSGTETDAHVPAYAYYKNAFSQMLYSANQVGIDGDIDSIAFYVSGDATTRTWSIYMAEVGQTSFGSVIPGSAFRQVFQGTVSLATGWVNIALDSTFSYQDTGTLAICVIDATGSYINNYPSFVGTEASGNVTCYNYNNYTTYSIDNLTPSYYGSFLPNIRLGISSYSLYCAAPTQIDFSNISSSSATATWQQSGAPTEWEILISDTVITDFSDAEYYASTVTTNSYTATGLNSNTEYHVYVRAICDASSHSGWTTATFRTFCGGYTSVPYSESFEAYETGEIPHCWLAIAQGTSGAGTFPAVYEYSTNARNSNVYFEFESSNGETEIAALPEMENINTLQLNFYASVMNVNFTLEAGVMEDTLFVPVDTIELIAGSNDQWGRSYQPYTVYFNNYGGNGSRIALRTTCSGTNSYTLMLDDLQVTEASSCIAPTRFTASAPSPNAATLRWRDNEGMAWNILYDTVAFNPDSNDLTPEMVYDTVVTLTDLTAGITYTAYVRGDCGGEYSNWVGPVTFTPGRYIMGYEGSDTIYACGTTIYDNGGPNNAYTPYDNFTLVVYPASEDSLISLSGNTDLYSYYARLRIYDGVGTNGQQLWSSSANNETFTNIRSLSGPVTIQFSAGSYNYSYAGFEITASCIGAPQCAFVDDITLTHNASTAARLSWHVTGLNLGTPASYEVVCLDNTGAIVDQVTTLTNSVTLTGLTPQTTYTARVRVLCDNGDYGAWDSLAFSTRPQLCAEFDTTAADSILLAGANSTTTNYFPANNSYNNYSYTQQLILSNELGSNAVINAIGFNYAGSSSDTTKSNCTIYLAHTTLSSLSTSFVPYDSNAFQMVYQGPLAVQPGWNRFDFIEPFHYNGGQNLVIAVLDNSGDYRYNNYFRAHTVSGMSAYGTSSSPIDINNPRFSATSYRNDMMFYVDGCSEPLNCGFPTPFIDSVSTTEIALSWMPGYQETSWELSYRASDTNVWTSLGTVNTPSYTLTGLAENTRYIIRVTALCTDSNLSSEIAARTTCVPTPVPFVYGFEDYGSAAPECWYKASTNPYYDYPYASNSYSHSGDYSLFINSGNGNHSYTVLPILDAPINTLELTVFAYNASSYSTPTVKIGVISDPEDFSTFVEMSTIELTTSNEWQPYRVSFTDYVGTAKYIAIAQPDNLSNGMYLDDLSVNVITSCPVPTHVTASNITPHTADIAWDSSDATDFVVEYGPSGFAHGSGMFVNVSNDYRETLTGLTQNVPYDVYVASFCGNDTSNWSLLCTFRTDCESIDSLPYFTGFEDIPSNWASYNSVNFYPCWTRTSNASSNDNIAYITSNEYRTGSYGLEIEYSSYSMSVVSLAMPAIDTTNIDIHGLQLTFWAMRDAFPYYDDAVIAVGIMSDPSDMNTFQPVDTITISNSDDYQRYDVAFANHTFNGNYIALLSIASTENWYATFDDFTIDLTPQCPYVGNLAASALSDTSVLVTWSERGTAQQYAVAYDTIGADVPANYVVFNDTSAVINGLTTYGHYYFWVRAICDEGDSSEWAGPVLAIPGSWNMRPNQTDTLNMCGGIIYDNGGFNQSYATNQDSYIVLMPDADNSLISITGMSMTEGTYHYFKVYDGSDTNGALLYSDYGLHDSTTFGPLVSSNGPLTLYLHSDDYAAPLYFGFEVHVNCISNYCRASHIELDTTIPESATALALTWHTTGTDSYEIEYGPMGFTQGSGTLTTSLGNSTVITGLQPSTFYDVYVRSICGTSDTGEWVSNTFRTIFCDDITAIYNYDTSVLSTSSTPYAPLGFSYYNYGYTQTLIDSAHLAGLVDHNIGAFAFLPTTTTAGNYFNHITVYMANVSETDLDSAFILPDSNHTFVKVLDDADLSYTSAEWQIVPLDTTFAWDGHSNLLLAVKRDHGSYLSGAQFAAHSSSSYITRFAYRDNAAYDITSVSGGTSASLVPDIQIMACNNVPCPAPSITSLTNDFESATVTWNGSGSTYEVNIKEASSLTWPTPDIAVAGNSYTFNALQPSTSYTIRVRQDCTADSLGYSEWVTESFTTDSLNCVFPTGLTVSDITNSTATFDWTPAGIETMWELHIWFTGGLDSIYTVSSHPATLGGFTAGLTYNVAIRSLCGTAHNIEGDWSTPITFTAATCPDVTGLSVSNVTANSVSLNWESNPMASSWTIEYGYAGFNQGSGTTVTASTNSITINSLECETEYEFFVKAVCGDDWNSENWTHANATTANCTESCNAPTGVTTTVNANSVAVSWTPAEGNTAFEVEYGTRGFSHGNGTIVSATEPNTTINGLDYNTQYDLYVRAICGTENYSAWSTVSTFTTEALGIDNAATASCTIYPNPTSSSTIISVSGVNGKVTIEVVDMNGRVAASETLECASDCTKTMDVDHLSQGAYFVRITGQSVNMVKKLIVR
ncbi:MAG: fibronectin type III domain-containing protein [Bacteroidales bacterium]|nr:fibronectin type III domain-containing protein [Bacteroidales bacterium]